MSHKYLGTEWKCDNCDAVLLSDWMPKYHPSGWVNLSIHITADEGSTKYGSQSFTVCGKCNPHNSNTTQIVKANCLKKLFAKVFGKKTPNEENEE